MRQHARQRVLVAMFRGQGIERHRHAATGSADQLFEKAPMQEADLEGIGAAMQIEEMEGGLAAVTRFQVENGAALCILLTDPAKTPQAGGRLGRPGPAAQADQGVENGRRGPILHPEQAKQPVQGA
jgi:hypothetical protein